MDVVSLSESIAELACKEVLSVAGDLLSHISNNGDGETFDPILERKQLLERVAGKIRLEFAKEIAQVITLQDAVPDAIPVHEVSVRSLFLRDIGVGRRTLLALEKIQVKTVGSLLDTHPVDIMDTPCIGQKAISELSEALSSVGVLWPNGVTLTEMKARRLVRLDSMSISLLSTRNTPGWVLSSLTMNDMKLYRRKRLRQASKEEIRDLPISDYEVLPYSVQRVLLESNNIKTFGELFDRKVSSVNDLRDVSEKMLGDIISGLRIIGRSLGGEKIAL